MCFMKEIRKTAIIQSLAEDGQRQYLNARSTFTALEQAQKKAAEVRGGMYWKTQNGAEYLIRTSRTNGQKSLGRRSDETQATYDAFIKRKALAEQTLKELTVAMEKHQRLNRALDVGRAPNLFVALLKAFEKYGLSEHFLVVGTHAIYAYEAAAGVRVESAAALATNDVDFLWDTRKRVVFVATMEKLDSSLIGLLQKVDPTFAIRDDQKYSAINSKGFEVDIIRREAGDEDPHPLQITPNEDDFWVTQARRANILLSGPKFSTIVSSSDGKMARVNTIGPMAFVKFKRWMAEVPDRDDLKRPRDRLQADIIEELVHEYLPSELDASTKNKNTP